MSTILKALKRLETEQALGRAEGVRFKRSGPLQTEVMQGGDGAVRRLRAVQALDVGLGQILTRSGTS